MVSFKLFMAFVAIFSVILAIVLFGSLPEFRGTKIHSLRNALLIVPRTAVALDRQYLGSKLTRIFTYWSRILKKPVRWIVPIGYIALISLCVWVFLIDCYFRLEISNVRLVLIAITIIGPYIFTPLAIFTLPGHVTSSTLPAALHTFPYDNIIFCEEAQDCKTCKQTKPARSKHCSTCEACVLVCDHHCIWLNNCVGHYNYRWFLGFLFANVQLLGYGWYLTFEILRLQVAENKLHQAYGPNISTWGLWQNTMLSNDLKPTTCLCLLCGTMVWLVVAFLFEHIRFLYLGVTTNESGKWEDVADCIADGSIYKYVYADGTEPESTQIIVQKMEDGSNGRPQFNRALTPEEQRVVSSQSLVLRPVKSVAGVCNIYDKGFKRNVVERVFPKHV